LTDDRFRKITARHVVATSAGIARAGAPRTAEIANAVTHVYGHREAVLAKSLLTLNVGRYRPNIRYGQHDE